MKKAIVMYAPVIHQGHISFLTNIDTYCKDIFLVDRYLVNKVNEKLSGIMQRNLQSLPTESIQMFLRNLLPSNNIITLDEENLLSFGKVFVPDDEIVLSVLEKFYPSVVVEKHTAFLRWNKNALKKFDQVIPDEKISTSDFDRLMMEKAFVVAEKSEDFWRQVGAVLLPPNAGKEISSQNHHLPYWQSLYIFGDPRSNFNPGENPEVYTSIHAEASIIARAAKNGISLDGASLYVTTFPCSNCARLILESGIKKVYYKEGYSVIDARNLFKIAGIDIVLVT